jgi:hypothetical protein
MGIQIYKGNQMETEKTTEHRLNPILEKREIAWLLLGISFALMVVENFLKINWLVGTWNIVIYLLLLIPLAVMQWKSKLVNPYIKWFFPLLLLMIWDMFYYSNELVQMVVPFIFYLLVIALYLTSMQKVHSFYQTLLISFELPWRGVAYLKSFFANLFIKGDDKQLYFRIGLALLITLPFMVLFISLLFSADANFSNFITHFFDFSLGFKSHYLFTIPWYLFAYLLLFIYALSNHKDRTKSKETKPLDLLIIGIFLGMINLLFLLFVALQLPFLFGEPNIPTSMNLAEFAREGFFQLMMVMGIVLLIFLFIMRRFKGEKIALILLSGLLIQTIIMGVVSVKKMYLYQSIKGATVMRYHVEWFDYFLLITLALGVVFLIRKLAFTKLLNVVAILGLLSFATVISLDVDYMVASHNIKKFGADSNKLDKKAISRLSIDALPAIQGTDINIIYYSQRNRDCRYTSNYHLGYCSKIKKYGTSHYKKYVYKRYEPTKITQEIKDVNNK